MRYGIFGKLPTKRDFIALGLPKKFLRVWEDWLQASVAASRQQLGDAWTELHLTAPIWRFWLGREICGATAAGAFMPSVDGVGRYFPLCICACAEAGAEIAPPGAVPAPDWYDRVERTLLRALGPDFNEEPPALLRDIERQDQPCLPDNRSEALIASMLADGLQAALAGESWWWTAGGPEFPVTLRRHQGLPDPYQFVGFMQRNADGQRRTTA